MENEERLQRNGSDQHFFFLLLLNMFHFIPNIVEEVLEMMKLRQKVEGWKTYEIQLCFFLNVEFVVLEMGKKCALLQLSVISQHDPFAIIALCTFVLIFGLTCVSKTK